MMLRMYITFLLFSALSCSLQRTQPDEVISKNHMRTMADKTFYTDENSEFHCIARRRGMLNLGLALRQVNEHARTYCADMIEATLARCIAPLKGSLLLSSKPEINDISYEGKKNGDRLAYDVAIHLSFSQDIWLEIGSEYKRRGIPLRPPAIKACFDETRSHSYSWAGRKTPGAR